MTAIRRRIEDTVLALAGVPAAALLLGVVLIADTARLLAEIWRRPA